MKVKFLLFIGLAALALTFSSCKKGKTVSCDWVGQAEYQQSNDTSSK